MSTPEYHIPPFHVESVFSILSESVDWGTQLLGIPTIWEHTKAAGIKVAVLDTGVCTKHPDLADAILDARDFTNSRTGPNDDIGHGTHVAGIIAARQNHSGIIGAAPECKLLCAKVVDGACGGPISLIKAIEWALNNKADIISMSLGSPSNFVPLQQLIANAANRTIFVAASGNEGPGDTVNYPARYPTVISVGAIDRRKTITPYSSRGNKIDVVAPGDQILSTWPPSGVARISGTSMAAPLVSGVVALMIANYRLKVQPLSHDDVRRIIKETAADQGVPGYDSTYGHGLINPCAVVLGPTL